ncbi:hypothetical protein FND36_00605 [Lachnospiraceae bacterium KGMB03038]|nr:hypothetical protein FND36_00605 [Lachnospiraceae bacterium KGMB03038]
MSRKCGKSWKYKLCGIAYRKRKFARKFSCVRNSMREVYMILNPDCHHQAGSHHHTESHHQRDCRH